MIKPRPRPRPEGPSLADTLQALATPFIVPVLALIMVVGAVVLTLTYKEKGK